MNYLCNQRKLSPLSMLFGLMALVMLVSGAVIAKPADPAIVAQCKADLVKQLDLKAADTIKVVEVTPIVWPDASLGMPEIGKMYAQTQTPGYRIILGVDNVQYLYTAGAKKFRYGGQRAAWYCSVLYLTPKPNDPNLNGDLYQCSVMGTNSMLLASEVSDYYPQEKGVVLFTRRTSRSGFDLLYVKANSKSKPVELHSAFAYGDVASDSTGKQWAAIVRPGLGLTWNVTIGTVGQAAVEKQTFALPDDVRPEQIAWVDDGVMIMAKKDDKVLYYEISPKAEKPEWSESAEWRFPGTRDFMLNKSESLLVDQVDNNGKPAVEIGTVWFTGDRRVSARIENFTMRGVEFPLANLYVFIWGENGSKTVGYTVDYARGVIMPLPQGVGSNFKPFDFPPVNNPLFREK